jgi:hypothetical protein
MKLTRRILVEIDVLFDTRIGHVKATQPEKLEHLDELAYVKRMTEAWAAVIGIEDWSKEYAKRTKAALQNAEPTEMLLVLRNFVERELLTIAMSSPIERPELTINFWPYTDLTEEERQAFLEMFRTYYNMVKLNIICENPLRLTPGRLRSAWDAWFMYDWYPWIKENARLFQQMRIPDFVINRPSLLTEELTDELVATIKRDRANPFIEATRFMAEYVTVDVFDTALFSRRPHRTDDVDQTPSS